MNLFILSILLRICGALKTGNPATIQATAGACESDIKGKMAEA
jgi:hypothetical protein